MKLTNTLLGLLVAAGATQAASAQSIIPKPLQIKQSAGNFNLAAAAIVVPPTATADVKRLSAYMADVLKQESGKSLPVKDVAPAKGGITLELKAIDSLGEEGYTLNIQPEGMKLVAATPAGLFHGIQSVRQLAIAEGNSLRSVAVYDRPQFGWRGFMLDVSRHYFPKEVVKRYIDHLALLKMNTFHWHLVDDEGWRIEIKKYPKLTAVGAYRPDRLGTDWRSQAPSAEGEAAKYGGFYTQADIREIVAYAAERYITVIPEIEMPAHALSAMVPYPQLACFDGFPKVLPSGGGPKFREYIYCAGNEQSFQFIDDVLTELAALFPAGYIHIGGDEAPKEKWAVCPKCQQRIKDEGLHNEHELQSYFIKRVEKMLQAKGKKLIGWDEIREGGLSPDATVMAWRGIKPALQSAAEGHKVIITPKHLSYFDYPQGKGYEPTGFGTRLYLEDLYNFDNSLPDFSDTLKSMVLGLQANLWTEQTQTLSDIEYRTFPRLFALAENAWSAPEQKDFNDFTTRMAAYYPWLDKNGINYRKPDVVSRYANYVFTDSMKVTLQAPHKDGEIRYTTDLTEPDKRSPLYTNAFIIKKDAVVNAREILPDGRLSQVKVLRFTKQALLPSVKPEVLAQGMFYKYYEATGSVKNLKASPAVKQGWVTHFELPELFTDNGFGVSFEGNIYVPKDGVYTFFLQSSDGSAMFIGDKQIVDNEGTHPQQEGYGQVALKAGYHPFSVYYYDTYQAEYLKVLYEGPGITKQAIPNEVLFR
ncbi:family 20 glycosylhydrolase [Chitinophaga horti]|uniref:beta-N-acetylhexosaminidase n=1 Tax=Chitinophaga horti TaxID=2920382 RepID=A0ABY6IWW7_9BACT|nr:family 20 glycosylhydrolase [Chitinophaga horti]UYQ91883.1 family 20 glycosylhydrolase [Chitinophaga horti]